MLNLNDLLGANLACRFALLSPDSLRALLGELDAQAPPGSLLHALRRRGFTEDRLQRLELAMRQRRAQLETQYFVALLRARRAVDPGILQALSQQQAHDGYRWSLADLLVQRGFLSAEACLGFTREAAQQLTQREQILIQENRRQGYALVLETGTTSGRHLSAPLTGSGSHRLSTSSSGSFPPPQLSGSGSHRAPQAGSGSYPQPQGAADFDGERTQPVPPPDGGFDPERTMGFSETLNVPGQPPPQPDFDAGAPTLMLPPGSTEDATGADGQDPCRTIGFDDVIVAPVAPRQADAMDAERTISLPVPGAPEADRTIALPPPDAGVENPFGTVRMGPGGGGADYDQTISVRPDLSQDVPDLPDGLERVRELGRGNMGVVYLARQPDQRLVAVKVILSPTKEAAARFRREILVSARVQHAHVIEVLDSGDLPNGTSYMAMEYLEGRELKELIQAEAPLPLARCLELMDQLFAALEAVHAAEIVHRDLKPENVQVLSRQGGDHLKLVDFGISRLLTQPEEEAEEVFVTMRGTLSGTPMYVAPEAIVDPDVVSKAQDVYAAGVILYELLTGKLPFAANRTLRDLLRDTVHTRPKPLEQAHPGGEFPPAVQRLVAKLLDKDDKARPADGAAARALLREVREELGGKRASGRAPRADAREGITQRLLRKITGIFRREGGA